MKKIIISLGLSTFYTFIFIACWNFLVMSALPELRFMDFRLDISSLFVVFFALKKRGPWLPWAVLLVESMQGLFSVTGSGHNIIAGLFVLMIANILKEFINVKLTLASLFFVQVLLVIRYMILSLFWAIKLEAFSALPEMMVDYLPQSFVMTLLSIPLFKLFEKIWHQRTLDSEFEMGHV